MSLSFLSLALGLGFSRGWVVGQGRCRGQAAAAGGTELSGQGGGVERGGGEAAGEASPPAPAEAGQESYCRASDVSAFHREDVGWWRSWLQQSYQAVKEKVSRASAELLSAGLRAVALQPDPASPTWAFRASVRPFGSKG